MTFVTLAATLFALSADPPKKPFEFADGDRVLFLGGTLIEREQKYGYWELALTLLNNDKNVTFRNLGWSGDTVWCESRGSFDGPKKGYENTLALVKELKPTVIVLCYGHVESFDGEAGVKKFTEGLEKLIDGVSVTKARVVLMSPTQFQNAGPVKDGFDKNTRLVEYTKAMGKVAETKKVQFFDLFRHLTASDLEYTENGTHLNAAGYAETAGWVVGVEKPEVNEPLRKSIVAKNELFFHRWRPQNQTYLFGFRKHEQGNNAKEVAEFDPLVEKAEKEIGEMRKKLK